MYKRLTFPKICYIIKLLLIKISDSIKHKKRIMIMIKTFKIIMTTLLLTITITLIGFSSHAKKAKKPTTQNIMMYEKQTKILSIDTSETETTDANKDGVKSAKKATQKKARILWESSNRSVAIVSKKGKVTALKKGKTTIKAISKSGKKVKAVYEVIVKRFKEINPGEENTFFIQAESLLVYPGPKLFPENLNEKRISDSYLKLIRTYKEFKVFSKNFKKIKKDNKNNNDLYTNLNDLSRFDKSFFEDNCLLVYFGSGTTYSEHLTRLSSNITQNENGQVVLFFKKQGESYSPYEPGVSYPASMIPAYYFVVLPHSIPDCIDTVQEGNFPISEIAG